jgi:hypothetical protein
MQAKFFFLDGLLGVGYNKFTFFSQNIVIKQVLKYLLAGIRTLNRQTVINLTFGLAVIAKRFLPGTPSRSNPRPK